MRYRMIACLVMGICVVAFPLFGPHRLLVGIGVIVLGGLANLALMRDIRETGRPTPVMAMLDAGMVLAIVALAPESLPIAAVVFASFVALDVFWFGVRTTLAITLAVIIGFFAIGAAAHPALWLPATSAVAICGTLTTLVLHTLAKSVRDTQRRFDELVNGIDAVVWEAGANGRIDFVSANITDVLGCSATTFATPGFIDIHAHPHDVESWQHARSRNAEGHSSEAHLRVRDDHGSYRRIQERVKVSLNPDGTVHRQRGLLMDETHRWDAEAHLRRYSDFIQGIPIALLVLQLTDPEDPRSTVITSLNPAARALLDAAGGDGIGVHDFDAGPVRLLDCLDMDLDWLERIRGVTMTAETYEQPFMSIPGAEGIYAMRAVPLPDHCIGISLEDVTRRERLAESFRHQALHDQLTGLPNRAYLRSRLDSSLSEAEHNGNQVALLVVDLDQFKEVNDALGHEYGDRLLAELSRRLGSKLRQCDTIARIGGDEFAVLLTNGADVAGATEVADRIIALCESPLRIGDFRFQVSASVGIAVAPEHGTDADTLLRRADGAMYRAKVAGGSVAVYSPGEDLYTVRRLELLGDLREAVGTDDLAVQYQPRIDLRTNRAVGVEALVRWHHPRHGMLPPDEFIELAEVSGTIHRLTQHVSERASAEMRGLVDEHDLVLSVNLSTRNLYDPKLVSWVGDLLVRHGIAPGSLYFEITESQLMDDPNHSLIVLHELRELGVRFSIDDFGTGYSSLSYLRELPIDEVKIDRIFVADVLNDDTIVRSVIDLGHNLGLHVVAEGVEDAPTMDRLLELGCDSAQGYHFGAPMDADELCTYLDSTWEDVVTLR
jgi:diguanylate cyclase (GGDEF)-like protein